MRKNPFVAFLNFITTPWVAFPLAIIIALGAVALAYQMSSVTPSGQYTTATLGSITAVGGASSDLSFQISGQVASVPVALGQSVLRGAVLVALDQSSLQASRAGAAANLEAAQARLAGLQAGTRPEQIAINQAAVSQAQQALRDTIRSAYIGADDAVHNKADQLFTNARNSTVAFAFPVSDQTLQNSILDERKALEGTLTSWGTLVNAQTFAATDPLADAQTAQANLASVGAFLDDVSTILAENLSSSALSGATLQGYQANITTARVTVSNSQTAITAGITALQNAQNALTLAQAGATSHDIAAAQAAVDAAQATLDGIDVSLRNSTITAPVAGTITALNAQLGQTVSPGQIIVSIQSTGGSRSNVLIVPTSSVFQNGGQEFVYVKNGSGAPVRTLVTTGLESDSGMIEITSGITAGTQVLTFGASYN